MDGQELNRTKLDDFSLERALSRLINRYIPKIKKSITDFVYDGMGATEDFAVFKRYHSDTFGFAKVDKHDKKDREYVEGELSTLTDAIVYISVPLSKSKVVFEELRRYSHNAVSIEKVFEKLEKMIGSSFEKETQHITHQDFYHQS